MGNVLSRHFPLTTEAQFDFSIVVVKLRLTFCNNSNVQPPFKVLHAFKDCLELLENEPMPQLD